MLIPQTAATFSVAAALDRFIENESTPHPYDGLWHPSSISGCQRKAVYEIRQAEETDPKTPKQKRTLFAGQVWHEQFQRAVSQHGGVAAVYTEVKVHIPELNTTGSGDQLVIFEDGTSELEEFKTIAPYGFVKLDGPRDDHLEQVPPYMFGLRYTGGVAQGGAIVSPQGDRLKQVRFTYIDKVNLDLKEFVVEWDPEWEPALREKIALLEEYKNDPDSLPPRLPMVKGKKSYMCDWKWGRCQFYERCWNVDPAEVSPQGIEF